MLTLACAATLVPLLVAGTVYAAVDLSADDMREAEETLHSLDSRISLQDRKALDDAKELARYRHLRCDTV